ncbi:MAG: methyltransferase domain-containing protein [Pyrobaculum sp.]
MLLKIGLPKRVMDFGCSNWRNSKFLESLGAYVVRVDALPETRPDVVAYPTHLPFRDGALDAVLFTHIFMFLNDKSEWQAVAEELKRIAKEYLVIETYAVKHKDALKFQPREIESLFSQLVSRKRYVRRDLQVFIYTKHR